MPTSITPTGKRDVSSCSGISSVPYDSSYYVKGMVGGLLACGITHAAIPLIRMYSVNPAKYSGIAPTISLLLKEEGSIDIPKGFGPTFVGYSLQGMFKYGLYKVFKDAYMKIAGPKLTEDYKGLNLVRCAASAEVVAYLALCPLEMTKVKIQTASPSGSDENQKAETRYPFGSLVPLWSRQIPYTMTKFYFFEKIVQLFYTHAFTAPTDTYSKGTQLGITFASGYIAGVICAIVSHPADSLVSQLGKAENRGKSIGSIASEGLGTRVLMIGTLTGVQ
ncbi:mitochondrial carrier domain-containing protein [Mucidula mucida]|nr:mitochondrial carrier domain-containing protein [Mucidula mucida]